jgi:hypothetical protein
VILLNQVVQILVGPDDRLSRQDAPGSKYLLSQIKDGGCSIVDL